MARTGPPSSFVAALLVAGGGAMAAGPVPRATTHPVRVMSLNECTDQLVLALLPTARIASISYLSRDPDTSQMAGRAARVRVNHGLSEEVLRQRPDLVIAGTYTTTGTRAMLGRLGWPLLEIGPADTIAAIRETTRRVARAVDAVDRGEALLARMDRQLAELRDRPGPRIRVAAWDGAGFSAARGTLYDTVLGLAGADNIAADPAVARAGPPDTELLLAAAPDLIVQGGLTDRASLRADTAYHPVVRRYWGGQRTLVVRPADYLCGTPFVGDAALRLRADLRARLAVARTPLPFAPGASR
jgi:iron complex transport system substrate-binding protein